MVQEQMYQETKDELAPSSLTLVYHAAPPRGLIFVRLVSRGVES